MSIVKSIKPDHTVTDFHHTAETEFIEANGNRFAYRILGNHPGIPLLLLQHFTGTLDNWDPAVTNGLAAHFKIILFDNRGIGASFGETPDTIEAMANDTRAFINALGFDKVNLLGFSMGGFIAQQLTIDHPQMVNKLILAGTAQKGAENVAEIVDRLNDSARMTPDDQKLFLFYSSTHFSHQLGINSLSRINRRVQNRDPETKMVSVESQLKSILAWAKPDNDFLKSLQQIVQPVFIVNGNNDIVVPTNNSFILQQHLPKGKLSLYPDSGHGSIFQYPELFLNEAIHFLQDVD